MSKPQSNVQDSPPATNSTRKVFVEKRYESDIRHALKAVHCNAGRTTATRDPKVIEITVDDARSSDELSQALHDYLQSIGSDLREYSGANTLAADVPDPKIWGKPA
jgi:hypothetical protein